MTADREGVDRLRVGGWLPPPVPARRRGAHAAPDDDEPEERIPPPAPYAAPPVDLDAPVSAPIPPPSAGRRSAVDTAGLAGVGRYVYQGRRRLGELVAPGPARHRAWLGLAGVSLLALAITAVAMLSPDGNPAPSGGRGLALPTAPPREPSPSAEQEIGPAGPTPSPTPSRTGKPPGAQGPFTRSYEAEDAARAGGARVVRLGAASGGRFVDNLGTAPGRRPGLVSFTVEVPATNRYALTVEYVSGEARVAILTVNSEKHFRLPFPASGHAAVASRTFTISLVGGRNNLTFSNHDGRAPGLDRINLLG